MDFNKALFGFIRVAFSIMIALLVLFAGIKICSICYDFGYRVFTEPAMTNGDGQDVLVQVEKGISAEELGQFPVMRARRISSLFILLSIQSTQSLFMESTSILWHRLK